MPNVILSRASPRTKNATAITAMPLMYFASSLPADASALESSISALERAITALESSSAFWEKFVWPFSALVVLGVAVEVVILWIEYRHELGAWRQGIVRPPERPPRRLFVVASLAAIAVAVGVAGELAVGVKIASINGALRTKSAELRSESDQLLALVTRKAREADERSSTNEKEAARLRKAAEGEQLARARIEERLAWRTISPHDHDAFLAILKPYPGSMVAVDAMSNGSPEVEMFAGDIADVLADAHWKVRFIGNNVQIPILLGMYCNVDERSAAGRALSKVLHKIRGAVVTPTPMEGGWIASIRVGAKPQMKSAPRIGSSK